MPDYWEIVKWKYLLKYLFGKMEKFIEVDGNWLFNDEHFLLTDRSWLKAKELQKADKVIGVKGESIIIDILECRKRSLSIDINGLKTNQNENGN